MVHHSKEPKTVKYSCSSGCSGMAWHVVAWHGWDAAEPHIHWQPAPCCVTQRDAHAHRVSVLLGKAKYGAAVAAGAT